MQIDQKFCHVYKLSIGDSLIVHKENNRNLYLILEGVIVLSKVFTNEEILSIGIFSWQDIIITNFDNLSSPNYFYKVQAICSTYIISINRKNVTYTQKIIHMKSKQTSIKYQNMIEILAHKNIKHRFIQLLLTLCNICGIIDKNYIEIQLSLSQTIIAAILGSNRNTINQLIQEMQKKQLIYYAKNKIIIYNLLNLSQTIY
uniref:Global nitrogen transcriptional regulator n=1 Tax=Kumanoa americana TaxID=1196377 RepID=A0A1C9CGU5_9FLOR|nr:global nitrogen transcriptional regulator [Kumanoa americana]AOM67582.1 global nitrogen transcriptional regulator [Kumanoa americana]